ETPRAGEVSYGGMRFERGNVPVEVLRRITLVFQRPLLLAGSVSANIEYPSRLRGSRDGRERMRRLLERFRLNGLARQAAPDPFGRRDAAGGACTGADDRAGGSAAG